MGLMDGKVVVITGAGRGIGRSHALRFAAEGAKVVVNDLGVEVESGPSGSGITQPSARRDVSVADGVVAEIRARGGEAIANRVDVSTFAGGQELIDAAVGEYGRIDSLINNAGTMTIMMFGEIDEQKLIDELKVHVVGYVGTAQAAWPHLVRQGGGTIVNTSSGFGGSGPGLTAYMAAKSGVFSITRDMALEGAPHGIRCNALTPSARTRMSTPYWGDDQTLHWDPDWASTLALFLASEQSEGITGRQLHIAPGTTVREMYTDDHVLVHDENWTPRTLAARIHELLKPEPLAPALRLPPLLSTPTPK